MNFRDQQLVCSVCGKPFIYTVTEQRHRHEEVQAEGRSSVVVAPSQCPSCRVRDPQTGRWVGRVKWYSYEKGYGFIAKPDGEEVFFHRSQVTGDQAALKEGAPVSFELIETDRGLEAQQVEVEA